MTERRKRQLNDIWSDIKKPQTIIFLLGIFWVGVKKTYVTVSYSVALVDTIHYNAAQLRRLEYKVDTCYWNNYVGIQKLSKDIQRLQDKTREIASIDKPFNLTDIGIN